MEVQVVPNDHRFVAMGAKDNVTDHEIPHWLDVSSIAFEAANRNVPSVDVRQLNEVDFAFGVCRGGLRLGGSNITLDRCLSYSRSRLCWGFSLCYARWRFALAFAETRLEVVVELSFWMQCPSPSDESLFAFDIIWVSHAAVDRAHGSARLIIVKSHALGT